MRSTYALGSSCIALLAATTIAATGCKPGPSTDGTELKTLDALAGTELAKNDCHGSSPSLSQLDASLKARAQRQITYPAPAAAAVDRAFTAVPAGLTRAILLLGYEIRYVADPAAECRGIDSGGLSVATGCAKVSKVGDGDAAGEKVTLVLGADPKDVAHATLLGVLTLASNKLGRIEAQDGALVLKDEESADMAGFRRDFALAVFNDTYRAGKSLPALAKLLPVSAEFTARATTDARRRQLWEEHANAAPTQASAAELSIFANGGDSYYCNAATKASLASWPTARDLWANEMHSDIVALAALGSASRNADADQVAAYGTSDGGGFGLWGWRRPFGGFFANRVANTGYAFPRLHGLRRGWDGSGDWYQPPAWGQGRLGWRLRGDYWE